MNTKISGRKGEDAAAAYLKKKKYKILKDLVGFNTIKDKQNKEIINYMDLVLAT